MNTLRSARNILVAAAFSMAWLSMAHPTTAMAIEATAHHLTMTDGLSNNTIRAVLQDSRGFIWFSTLNGLNRYDGSDVKVIVPTNNGKTTLSDRRIKSVRQDKWGYLWIKTAADYVDCYDTEQGKFVDFAASGDTKKHYRNAECLSNGTWLWGDEGCMRVTIDNGRFKTERFDKANGTLENEKVKEVVECGKDVWVATQRGLYRWSNGRMEKVDGDINAMWVCASHGKSFFVTFNGAVWAHDGKRLRAIGNIPNVKGAYDLPGQLTIGDKWIIFTSTKTYQLDMNTYQLSLAPESISMERARVATDNKGDYWLYNNTGTVRWIERTTGLTHDFKLMTEGNIENIDQERYHVVQARNGIIWIATYGNGLFAYDTNTQRLQHFTADSNRQALIQSNRLLCVTEDRSGNIWVGTWLAGVSQINVAESGIYESSSLPGQVRMLATEPQGLWIANTTGKLFHTNGTMKNVEAVDNDGGNIYSLLRNANGTLWLGSRTKGVRIGQKWYSHNGSDKGSLSHNAVYAIVSDRKGRIWIGTLGGGVNLATPDGHGGYTFKHFLNKAFGINGVRCLAIDKKGWVWAGTSDGLVVFDPDRIINNPDDFSTYNTANGKLRSNEVRSILCDRQGRMWVAETGEGFCIATKGSNPSQLTFKHYNNSDGLINSMVQAFAEDSHGRIWISTEYGLSCFTPKTESFRNFFFATTIEGNTFSENCAATMADGRIAFGTSGGIAIIDPKQVKNEARPATVTFTDMTVNGTRLSPNDEAYPMEKALPYAKEIKLKHGQNSFVIYFSTLEYSTESQTLYCYRLENYDKEWSTPSPLNFAAYKNMKAGTYYLHVKATGVDGTMGTEESVIRIVIAPPLWATPWAYAIYALIIAIGAYVAYRTLRKMDKLRTQVKVEEQLADYKLTFFTNISHEFRTPLTLIQAALERLQRTADNPQEHKQAMAMMEKSVGRMLRLINELLEFRKAEKGRLTLALEATDIVGLLKGVFDTFGDNAKSKGMDYRFDTQLSTYTMPIDRGKLDKIVFNLLSNAFKYTPAGGTVSLCAHKDNKRNVFVIKVKDNGVGIPKSRRKLLFTRFASGNASRNSIGIGLHLVNELVTVHKGTINYDENSGGGSVFTVCLPADGSAYEEKDYLADSHVLLDGENKAKKSLEEKESTEKLPITPMNDRTILVIEDDDDVRSLLVSELSAYATVVAKADGTSGYEYARANDVDLILCDVMMPGMDGFELTKRIKEDFDTSHIPVILLTALNAEESQLKGAQCGADTYITKPFSSRLLLTRVFKLIEQREKLKEKFSNDVTAVRPFISTTDKDKEFADRLTQVINANMTNSDFDVDEFASAMSLGRTILYRKVKGVTGYTPKEYLRIVRMKKAAELLLNPDVNVSEAAYAVGMSDPFYFSKCFKQQFGVSPSVYKKEAADRESAK